MRFTADQRFHLTNLHPMGTRIPQATQGINLAAATARHRAASSGEKYNAPTPHSVIGGMVIQRKMFRRSLTPFA